MHYLSKVFELFSQSEKCRKASTDQLLVLVVFRYWIFSSKLHKWTHLEIKFVMTSHSSMVQGFNYGCVWIFQLCVLAYQTNCYLFQKPVMPGMKIRSSEKRKMAKNFNLHWKDPKTLCNGRPYLSAKSFHFMRNFLGLGEGSGSFNLSAKNSTNFCSSNKRGTR